MSDSFGMTPAYFTAAAMSRQLWPEGVTKHEPGFAERPGAWTHDNVMIHRIGPRIVPNELPLSIYSQRPGKFPESNARIVEQAKPAVDLNAYKETMLFFGCTSAFGLTDDTAKLISDLSVPLVQASGSIASGVIAAKTQRTSERNQVKATKAQTKLTKAEAALRAKQAKIQEAQAAKEAEATRRELARLEANKPWYLKIHPGVYIACAAALGLGVYTILSSSKSKKGAIDDDTRYNRGM